MNQATEQSEKPEFTPILVHLSEAEFQAFILPHWSLPKRGPQQELGAAQLASDNFALLSQRL
jgi:hypothetical protein